MSDPSKTFGRYRLIRKLAQGGMAEIFLAHFRGAGGFEKKVIIKRILPRFSQNQEFIKMLVQEAKLAVQLHHANVVQIYDLGRVRDSYFISMEYIKGRDLRTVANRLIEKGERMPQQIAVYIAREMCKGLEYAHGIVSDDGLSLNLVHRDISPPNILLSLDGEVKIIDFGIAKATAKATDTQAGVFKGKFAYMSPEQASGKRIDRRTDVFATGLVLYEMLTNIKLLDAPNDMATLEKAKGIDKVDLKLDKLGFPGELNRIIGRALAGDAQRRYQTAGEMARELTIFLNTRYPTFTEVDVSRFMRKLFNLDRRPASVEDNDPQLIPSLAGSLELADDRPMSVRTTQNLAALGLSHTAPAPKTPSQESGVWALEEELVASLGGEPTPAAHSPQDRATGGLQSVSEGPPPQWVSQVSPQWGDVGQQEESGPQTGPAHPALDPSLEGTLRSEAPAHAEGSVGEARGIWRGAAVAAITALIAVGMLVGLPIQIAAEWPFALRQARHEVKNTLGMDTHVLASVVVAPAGAQITIDGMPLPADGQILLPTGAEHQIEAHLKGYERGIWVLKPEQDADRVVLNEALKQAPRLEGRVAVASEPAGAKILINGIERRGLLTPAEIDELPVGETLTVTLALEGYEPVNLEVSPSSQAGEPLVANLAPRPIALEVISHPPDAEVYLDERLLDEHTPLNGTLLQPGANYQLKVTKSGYQPYVESLHTQLGEDITLRLSLAPLPATPQNEPDVKTKKVDQVAAKRPPAKPAPAPVTKAAGPPPSAPATGASEATEIRALQAAAARQVQQQLDSARVNVLVLPETLRAEVYLNGEFMGHAPIRNRTLGPGQYTLRLKSAAANLDRAWEKVILVEDTGKTLTWEFEISAPAP